MLSCAFSHRCYLQRYFRSHPKFDTSTGLSTAQVTLKVELAKKDAEFQLLKQDAHFQIELAKKEIEVVKRDARIQLLFQDIAKANHRADMLRGIVSTRSLLEHLATLMAKKMHSKHNSPTATIRAAFDPKQQRGSFTTWQLVLRTIPLS
eukprot:GDKI01041715.1.p1 GENE.GDKI01041715.1~~GDKI01041715.1.p1  ORF type:complete len:149 (+),score=20.50 GDKI01041715.1:105-551(+)